MSAIGRVMVAEPHRGVGLPLGIAVAGLYLLVAGNLAGNGFADPVAAWAALPGWEQGSLLRLLVVTLARGAEPLVPLGTGLVLLYVLTAAAFATALYHGLCRSNWPPALAALLVLLLAGNALVVYAVTTASPELLLAGVLAVVIQSRRQLEADGTVQSVLHYGLVLPLLLLAGPPLMALLPLMVLAVPLDSGEAWRSRPTFVALLLVMLAPALIVVAGATAAALRAGQGADFLFAPLGRAFTLLPLDWSLAMPQLLAAAAVALVLPLHLVIRDRRRQPRTTLLALLLPVYLGAGRLLFGWGLAATAVPLALLATSAGWLGATRLRPGLRIVALALVGAGTVLSWWLAADFAAPDWRAALYPIRLFGWTF